MIVVSDTSPIRYLVLLGIEEILPALFGEILVPPAVRAELQRANTPDSVRKWATHPPAWLLVRTPTRVNAELDLHRGEAEALSLVVELKADRVIVDDLKARGTAKRIGLRPIGTLAILETAAARGMIPLAPVLDQLRQTNFHITQAMIAGALKRAAERNP